MGGNSTVVGWAPQPRECNTWSFCTSPIGCSAGSGSGLVQRVSSLFPFHSLLRKSVHLSWPSRGGTRHLISPELAGKDVMILLLLPSYSPLPSMLEVFWH